MAKRHEIDITTGSIPKKVLQFAVPLLLSSFLHVLYHSADTIVVGRFAGSTPMAAVGSTGSLVMLIVNLFTGLTAGTNVMTARYYGSKEYNKVSEYVHASIALSMVLGLMLGVIGFFLSTPLLRLMHVDNAVLPLSSLYLKLYFLGTPLSLVYQFSTSILRALGDTKRPLYFSAISGLANILLNVVFVVVFHMSVAGVALATVISQGLSCFMALYTLVKTDGPHKLSFRKLQLHKEPVKDIIRIGLPVGLNSTVFNFANVTIQSAINSLGAVAMAGDAAARTLDGLIASSMSAFYAAAAPFVSQNIGAKRYDRLGKVIRSCMLMSSVTAVLFSGGMRLLGRPLLGLFVAADDPTRDAVISAGLIRLTVVALPYFLCGIMDVAAGALRGMGRSWTPFLISIIGTCAVRIGWVALVFSRFQSAEMLYLCFPVSWFITMVVTIGFMLPQLRKTKKQGQVLQA